MPPAMAARPDVALCCNVWVTLQHASPTINRGRLRPHRSRTRRMLLWMAIDGQTRAVLAHAQLIVVLAPILQHGSEIQASLAAKTMTMIELGF